MSDIFNDIKAGIDRLNQKLESAVSKSSSGGGNSGGGGFLGLAKALGVPSWLLATLNALKSNVKELKTQVKVSAANMAQATASLKADMREFGRSKTSFSGLTNPSVIRPPAPPIPTAIPVAEQVESNPSIGSRIKGLLSSGASSFMNAPPLAKLAGGAAILIVAAKKLYEAGDKQIQYLKEYAKYSPILAQAYAVNNIQDIQRNMSYAQQTAQSTRALIISMNKIKDLLMPLQVFFTNVANGFLSGVGNGASFIANGWGEIAHTFGLWLSTSGKTFDELVKLMREQREKEKLENQMAKMPFNEFARNWVNGNRGAHQLPPGPRPAFPRK